MNSITFITGNAGKVVEIKKYVSIPVDHIKIDLPEIQSLELKEISTKKAQAAYAEVKKPVLIEDVGLTFHALGKLPGPLIKWFLTELKNEGLCKLVENYQDKSATATIVYTLYDGNEMRYFEGQCNGSIAAAPRGENGFGWDQIFIPEGQTKTFAQMTTEEKNAVSHRGKALQKLQQFINNT